MTLITGLVFLYAGNIFEDKDIVAEAAEDCGSGEGEFGYDSYSDSSDSTF